MKLFRRLPVTTVVRAKAAVALVLLGVGVSVLMYTPFSRHLRSSSEQRRLDALKIFEAEYHEILVDTARIQEGALNREEWWFDFNLRFKQIAELLNFSYFYYILRTAPNHIIFILDTTISRDNPDDPEVFDRKGGFFSWDADKLETPGLIESIFMEGKPAVSPRITSNEFGQGLGAYLPVIKNGEVVGVLGADVNLEYIRSQRWEALIYFLLAAGISVIAAGLLSMNITRSVVSPLEEKARFAASASEASGTFMAKISREIRLPVNAIAGMSELALRENIPTPAREYITEIRDTGFSLLKIIDDIVDFTNIETGELELKPAPYSVVPLIKSCIEICRLRITERGLRFNIDIDEKLPSMLIGDENRIKQIIFNLLTNAAKYTSEGSVTFSVAAKSAFNRIILTIRVEDSGIGMTEEQAAVVFGDDRDESAESWIEGRTRETKDRRIHGIGLGLSISRELCRLMGGSIGVKSTLGEGTAFTVELPQDVSDSRPIGQVFAANANEGWITAPVPEIQAFFPAWTAAKAHILVIDDMMTNLKIMKNLLKPYRCTVYQCLTGNQAVEQVGNDWYDLVFLEHEMTGLDGIETVETIRRLPIDYAKAVPIIALSSDVVPGTRESYIARGFNDYLSKPVRMTSLNEILEKWIPDRLKERTELGTPPV